jgi:hypothetical protein
MTDATKPDRPADSVEGEGSYTATRDYQKSVQGFMDEKRGQIDDLAQDAERALEGPEGEGLRRAEEDARARAKN